MFAPMASETRSPLSANRLISGVLLRSAESGSDEHGSDLVAVQAGGVRLVVEAWSTNVHRRRNRNESFFFGVPVEACDRAQPPSDRCSGAPAPLQVTAEAFDVRPARPEQRNRPFCAPLHPLAQVQLIRLTGEPAVSSEESDERLLLLAREDLVANRDRRRHRNDLHLPTSSSPARKPSRMGQDIGEIDDQPLAISRPTGQSVSRGAPVWISVAVRTLTARYGASPTRRCDPPR